jgi:hypothetical protein
VSLTAGRSVGQVSDRSGWYNIYWAAAAGDVCLKAMDAEFAGPMWALGGQAFHFLAYGSRLCPPPPHPPVQSGHVSSIPPY